jgi:hypothetical protein
MMNQFILYQFIRIWLLKWVTISASELYIICNTVCSVVRYTM